MEIRIRFLVMSFSLGVTFSNLQQKQGPPIFCSVVIKNDDYVKVGNLINKDYFSELFESKSFFLDFTELENEIQRISPYCKHNIIEKEPSNIRQLSNINFYLDAFYEVIQNVISEDIRFSINNLNNCYIRAPLDPNNDYKPINPSFHYLLHKINKFSPNFIQDNFDLSIEIARLFSWHKNLLNHAYSNSYLNNQFIYDTNHKYYKASKMNWNNAELSQYSFYFVGWPSIYLLGTDGQFSEFFFELGQYINLLPLCNSCQGIAIDGSMKKCIRSSDKFPLGQIITQKEELCVDCNSSSKYSICIKYPQCDGLKQICQDEILIDEVCLADWCLYISIFLKIIKIGRTRVYRVVSRLIEQSSYDAIVLYPIKGLITAAELENNLIDLLRKKINEKNFGYKFTPSTPNKVKERHIKNSLKKVNIDNRMKVYSAILNLLKEESDYSNLDIKYVNLRNNWRVKEDIDLNTIHFSEIQNNVRLSGEINGVLGSYVLIDNILYNFNKIGGRIIAIPNQT